MTIEEVWNCEKRKTFIEKHINHEFDKLPNYCRNCMDWQAVGAETYQNNLVKRVDWKEMIVGKKDDKPQLDNALKEDQND